VAPPAAQRGGRRPLSFAEAERQQRLRCDRPGLSPSRVIASVSPDKRETLEQDEQEASDPGRPARAAFSCR
jgi:hypothetical protein